MMCNGFDKCVLDFIFKSTNMLRFVIQRNYVKEKLDWVSDGAEAHLTAKKSI